MRRILLGFVLILSISSVILCHAHAAPLRIKSAGLSRELLPLWIAQDKRIFKTYGFEKEAVILGIGDQTSRFSALRSGTVDATVISPPLTVTARKLGFNLITSFQDAGITWAYNSIDAKIDYTRQNRDVVLNFLKAFIEGNAYIRKNKEESLVVLTHWMRLNDREALDET